MLAILFTLLDSALKLCWEMVLLPIVVALSPLCMLSSEAFTVVANLLFVHGRFITTCTVVIELLLSTALLLEISVSRFNKSIFYWQYIIYTIGSSTMLVGTVCLHFEINCLAREITAKVAISGGLIIFVETLTRALTIPSKQKCAICFDVILQDTYNLRCSHQFHERCISQWVVHKPYCPCCRGSIV